MSLNTIENGRAAYAYAKVKEIAEKDSKEKSSYRSRVLDLPMMIKVNGFANAIAFYYAKKKDASYLWVYMHIQEWLQKEGYLPAKKELMEAITEINMDTYRLMTNETMALAAWMKRFAEGMIESAEERQEKKESDKNG